MRLCPNRNETFTRKDGKTWDIQTNHRGERILSDEKEDTNLWIIGDSMAMGYGLPTKETLAFYLKTKYNLNARVIAVDAIGTNGISRLLKETLTGTKEENHPKKIFWIWNPSDFIDDEREKTGLKRFLYPIHHLLSRYSYTYRYFLPSPPNNVYTSYGTPILYPKEHITYSNLFQFLNDPSISKEKLSILFSLGMSREGKPDTSDPNYDETKKFFIQEGMNTIDLRKKTEELFKEQKQIYIPGDGHPGPALAELFADAIASEFLNLQ
ncbi:hypothetical protein EHQ30_00560 [Leptospira brenneri]|uniref:SGNH/GDSL hydrolase family protein n=1 Tax=Leptospira brenneri TaxID=2023182 RepID=A0A2M9Y0T5_9LEPT|nr:hypothetical protein CH361_12480 [Leptospira brenneri]TGK97107.1 hypothetical protein EHQ30_00560 [Leptospira brenneri]